MSPRSFVQFAASFLPANVPTYSSSTVVAVTVPGFVTSVTVGAAQTSITLPFTVTRPGPAVIEPPLPIPINTNTFINSILSSKPGSVVTVPASVFTPTVVETRKTVIPTSVKAPATTDALSVILSKLSSISSKNPTLASSVYSIITPTVVVVAPGTRTTNVVSYLNSQISAYIASTASAALIASESAASRASVASKSAASVASVASRSIASAASVASAFASSLSSLNSAASRSAALATSSVPSLLQSTTFASLATTRPSLTTITTEVSGTPVVIVAPLTYTSVTGAISSGLTAVLPTSVLGTTRNPSLQPTTFVSLITITSSFTNFPSTSTSPTTLSSPTAPVPTARGSAPRFQLTLFALLSPLLACFLTAAFS